MENCEIKIEITMICSFLIDFLVFFLSGVFVGLLWYFRKLKYYKRHNIPHVSMKFSHIFDKKSPKKHLALQYAEIYNKQRHSDCPIILVNNLSSRSIVIVDVELVKKISTEYFNYFADRGMYFTKNDPLTHVLGSLHSAPWKSLRSKLTPRFTSAKLKQIFGILKSASDKFIGRLSDLVGSESKVIEFCDLFNGFISDEIVPMVIGIEYQDSNEKIKFCELLKMAKKPNSWFHFSYLQSAHPKIARYFGIRKHSKEISNFIVDLIFNNIQRRKQDRSKRSDYLQFLIDLNLNETEIAALVYDLISGVRDTLSTLSFCLFELANNTNIQERTRQDILSIFEHNNGELTYDTLNEMVYCKNVINGNLAEFSQLFVTIQRLLLFSIFNRR